MKPRAEPYKAAPEIFPAIKKLQDAVDSSGLALALIHLVYLRVSQVNHCAFCIDMHVREAKAAGETDARLHLLNAWHEAPVYTPRERAALAWAEAVTLVSTSGVPDEVYAEAQSQFNASELARLTLAIVTINSWNRIAISFRIPPTLGKS